VPENRATQPKRPSGSGKVLSGRVAVATFGPGSGALIHDVNQQARSPTGSNKYRTKQFPCQGLFSDTQKYQQRQSQKSCRHIHRYIGRHDNRIGLGEP
jgi:hypothetical protein